MATTKDPDKVQSGMHEIQALPVIHKKYTIEAFAIYVYLWENYQYPGVSICVLIMNEDGTAVTDLQYDNFRVDYFDQVTAAWRHIPIYYFAGLNDPTPSFYRLGLHHENFPEGYFESMVFSVEASNHELSGVNKIKYRGHSLAYMRPNTVPIPTSPNT